MHSVIPYSPDLESVTPNVTSNRLMTMLKVLKALKTELHKEINTHVYIRVIVDVRQFIVLC